MTEKEQLPTNAKGLRLKYGVSPGTWRAYIKPLNIRKGARVYKPHEMQLIVTHLGNPLENP